MRSSTPEILDGGNAGHHTPVSRAIADRNIVDKMFGAKEALRSIAQPHLKSIVAGGTE
jgi:hypothetical protein